MSAEDTIVLYHSPQSRSSATLTLLEELGQPYELRILNMKAGEQRQGSYLAINPLGKVPAVLHMGELVTEQVAIYLYLADLFPKARMAPLIGDRMRGPYLRWMVYYAACYEPALVDRGLKREPAPPAMSTYGDFDTMIDTLVSQLGKAPYLLGDTISAADILWGTALNWGMMWKMVPENPIVTDFVKRVTERPSGVKVTARDIELAAEHAASVRVA